MLDDWLDGADPDAQLEQLGDGGMQDMDMPMGGMDDMGDMGGGHAGMEDMAGMGGDAASDTSPLGGDGGDVVYPRYLINGRPADDPDEIDVEPGQRVRLRLINAGSDTAFRVAAAGTQMTVVATDGFDVEPFTADAVLVGMGERYDVVVTASSAGVLPLVAAAEGKDGQALALLRSGPGDAPAPGVRPAELDGELATVEDLVATSDATLPQAEVDRTYRAVLTGGMDTYQWGIEIDGDDPTTMTVKEGERVRVVIDNQTMMWHPIHLHGTTFQVIGADGTRGARKDTVAVTPGAQVTIELQADNPGQWMLHCHNAYHLEAGMMAVIAYLA